MDSFATGFLIVVGLIAFNNYRAGTLATWLRAKFLNSAAPSSGPSAFDGGTGSAGQSAMQLSSLATGTTGFVTPVQGTITDKFGAPRPNGKSHAGEDIAAPTGTAIKASTGGVVTYAGQSGAYGNRVDIDQGNGVVTRYGHLSEIDVRSGQPIGVGQFIGKVGATGDATGPHLHFEIIKNGVNIDPAPYINYGIAPKVA